MNHLRTATTAKTKTIQTIIKLNTMFVNKRNNEKHCKVESFVKRQKNCILQSANNGKLIIVTHEIQSV